jgi:hypothetical protein
MSIAAAQAHLKQIIADAEAALRELSEPAPQPPPQPKHRHGVVIHFSDKPADYPLKAGGITAVRGWISLAPDGTVKASDLAGAKAWRDAGYFVIACVHPSQASSVNGPLVDQWAAHLTVGSAGVDVWEVGNECDLSQYWPNGNWRDAVMRFIVPMARSLRERMPDAGIIPGALGNIAKQSTYEADYAAALKPIRDIAPAQAIHPYSTTTGDLRRKLERMRDVYRCPLMATEWDFARGMTDSVWTLGLKEAIATVRELTTVDCFYRIKDGNPADNAGRNLFDVTGKLTQYGTAYFGALR